MLRILLIISLVFCLSIVPSVRPVYATCGTCGVSAPGDSGGGRGRGGGGSGAAGAAAAVGLLFGALMAARSQEEPETDLDELATELIAAFNLVDPTVGEGVVDIDEIFEGPILDHGFISELPSQPEDVDIETEEVAESTEEVSEEPEEPILSADVSIAIGITYPGPTEEISEEPETTTTPTPEEVVKGRVTEEEGDPTPTTTVRF